MEEVWSSSKVNQVLRPVSISRVAQPICQISTFLVTASPAAISGAVYHSEPGRILSIEGSAIFLI